MKTRFLFSLIKPYLPLLILAIFGSLLESGALAAVAYIIKNVVDDVFVSKDFNSLVFVIVVLVIIAFAKQIGFFLKNYLYPLVIYKMLKKLREQIFSKLLNAEPSFFLTSSYGDIISRATNDLERLGQILSMLGTNVITEIFVITGVVIILLYRDWKLFVILLFAVPLLSIALNYFGEKRKLYSQKLQESMASYTQILNQVITGFELIKLFSKEIFLKIFSKVNNELYDRQKKNTFYETVYLGSVELIAYAATAAIIFYGGYRIIKGEITPGDFFSFLGGVLILVNSLQTLQRGAVQLKALSPVIDRIKFLLNLPEEKEEGEVFNGLKDKIQYKNVNLKIGENQILKNINLTIRKGEKVGIIGLTGSGKSTLVKLIPALIKNFDGNLLIDNVDVRQYNVSSLRKHIGMVSQDVFIFNDTLRNNLLIAKPDATDEELIQALKKAKADFVFKLEKGLDTVLGERGSRLSGGERQRIAIARLFLKNPDIIIIDEGTSALDVETEEYIMEEIKQEFSDRTILMITHRLKMLDITNRVVVMENGQIVEEGTKEKLLEKKGIFYKFCTLSG